MTERTCSGSDNLEYVNQEKLVPKEPSEIDVCRQSGHPCNCQCKWCKGLRVQAFSQIKKREAMLNGRTDS